MSPPFYSERCLDLPDEIKPPLSTAVLQTKSMESQDPLPERDQTADIPKSPSQREEPVGPESVSHSKFDWRSKCINCIMSSM